MVELRGRNLFELEDMDEAICQYINKHGIMNHFPFFLCRDAEFLIVTSRRESTRIILNLNFLQVIQRKRHRV